MKTGKCVLSIAFVITLVAVILALPGMLPGQTAAAKSSGGDGTSATRWSVQVDQVDPGKLDLASSFQIAIYENLVEELKKTNQFQQVFRDGDLKASSPACDWRRSSVVDAGTGWRTGPFNRSRRDNFRC